MEGMYQPLSTQQPEIRLLQLLPAENLEASVQCQLTQVLLSDSPNYECLSYAWGSTDFTISIDLNGQSHFVTPNLDLAMRHIRLPTKVRTLWVDAICINQTDTVERNRQVSLMRRIYGGCKVDLAWIYTPSKRISSARVADGLRFMEEICKRDMERIGEERRPLNTDYNPYSKAYGTSMAEPDFADGTRRLYGQRPYGSDDPPEWFSCDEMCLLEDTFEYCPFWTRVWIMQEVACAPEVILCASDAKLNWKAMSFSLDRAGTRRFWTNRGQLLWDIPRSYWRLWGQPLRRPGQ